MLAGTTVTVGREPENDVCLPFTTVSRRHAIFVKQAEEFELRDLNSTNGTFVNDEPVTRVVLRSAVALRFGTLKVLFSPEPASQAAPSRPIESADSAAPQPAPRVVSVPSAPPDLLAKPLTPVVVTRPKVGLSIGSVLKKRTELDEATSAPSTLRPSKESSERSA